MHKLMKQKLVLFKKQKVEIILTKIFRTFSMLYFFVGTNSSLSLRELSTLILNLIRQEIFTTKHF
jgi:hypothetical protein